MQLTARYFSQPFRFRAPRVPRRPVAGEAASAPASPDPVHRSGAPQDRALYACGCGFAWTADVLATVDCPNCGSRQAW